MKKLVLVAALLRTLISVEAQNKNIAGTWEGKLNAGVELRIVFHFEQKTQGVYSATMDSPDQGVKGIPVTRVEVANNLVTAELSSLHGVFIGELTSDSVMTGSWSQGPAVLPLVLKHVQKATELLRPQTPHAPFDYVSEDVEYTNMDQSVHFGGTLTFPKSAGPFPTALLITGSGPEDRDETIFGHKPFAVIADYLSKKGYAVLRVDDRGVGKTTGNAKTATSADFAKDVEAGLTFLKSRKEVDKRKVGLIGHSEGGLIASLVAARNKDVDFVVMLAGPGVSGADLLADQGEAMLNTEGVLPEASAAYKPMYREIMDDVLTAPDSAAAMAKAYPDFVAWKKRQTPAVLAALNITSDGNDKKLLGALVKQLSSPWMRYFLSSDPRPLIEKFRCKVLAMNGSRDIQVLAGPNLGGIESALKKSHVRTYQIKKMDGLNHLFQHCVKCSALEYGQLQETFAPEALETVGQWLDANVK